MDDPNLTIPEKPADAPEDAQLCFQYTIQVPFVVTEREDGSWDGELPMFAAKTRGPTKEETIKMLYSMGLKALGAGINVVIQQAHQAAIQTKSILVFPGQAIPPKVQ